MNRVKIMSSKEIIHGFVDRLKQHFRQFNESFLLYSKSKRGKITKTDFRKILSDCGIYLNSEDFGIVCQFINFNEKGSLNYDQFLKSFANLGDPGVHGPDIKILNSKNHHVNKHREPHDESLFVKDLNVYMNSKLRENFGSLRQAFSKLDFNHVGYLTCLNFKRLFSLCMLNMSNSNLNFEKFCKNLNIDETKKIYYKDFLDLFEIRENLNNGHKWLVSNHRYNLCKDDKLMTAQQVHRLMALKAHQHYKDLACAFCLIDAPVSSTIRRNGLRATLKKFNFNINEEEFETLWRIYDEDNKGELSFPKFISKLVGEQFTPGDLNGTSSRIYLSHFAEINRQKENQSNIHDILSQNNVNNLAKLDIDGIINMIVEKLREYYRNYYTAFKAFDTKKKGYLIKSDIIHGLETMNIFLNELKRKELFEKLKMEDSGLNYKLFMRYFKDGNFDVVKIDKINNEKTYNKSNFSNLKLPYVYLPDNFYEIIFEKFHVLEKAFIAIDVDKKGILPKKSFKQIIKIFCMDLNTKQFKELFERLSMNGTKDTVEYTKFLNYISQGKENVETTKSQSTTKYVLSEDDVHLLDYLKKQIQNNHKDITSTFKCACHSESVDMSTFMKLLSPYLTELCDDKLSHLMNELLVEEFKEDKIDWKKYFDSLVKPIETKDEDSTEFINNNSLHDKTNKIEGINTIQNTQTQKFEGSIKSNNFTCTSMLSKYTARSFTSDASATSDFVNAQNVDNKIEKLVKKNWRKLFKAFKEQDKLLNGHISNENFRDAMLSINSTIPIELINKLISKYDIYSNSKINYREFIKYFVIKKCETIKEEMYDDSFRNRIKMFMKDNWKEIRRRFLVCDSKRSGHITIDQFRFILREMNINLDEMEFIHLLDQYDTNFDGQIAYNKFIANFLKK
ncbi:DJ-1-binding protein [Intoshia linei]|uniref:DJ-1-binding protein n=1 Tax=Intoshia linei TaxID=1819745 RepID=A0A177B9H4_9BILA|nr:DJ-1-binding protein [Intoshia linei]